MGRAALLLLPLAALPAMARAHGAGGPLEGYGTW